MTRWFLILALVACSARNRAESELPDPDLLAADRAWEERGTRGLRPVEDALLVALGRRGGDTDPAVLWRHARYLVQRGITEEADRRVALDTYAAARAQAMRCLEAVPVWRQRRKEAGLEAALLVVDDHTRPCVAWGALAWARWAALMGGEAAALDLEDIATMARYLDANGVTPETGIGRWAGALVAAIRPGWGEREPDRGRARLERVIDERPRDLVPHWDLLVLVALPSGDEELAARERKAILEAKADTPADMAVRSRVEAMTAME